MVADEWVDVGERVREARAAAGLSQGELASRLRVDRTAVVRIEKGERGLNALELFDLADALDVPAAYFVDKPPRAMVSRRATLSDQPTRADKTRFRLDVALQAHARQTGWLVDAGVLTPTNTPRPGPTDPFALAALARDLLDTPRGPLGPMAEVAERLGLYLTVVDVDADGASMSLVTYSVAVTGAAPDPGRRRWTAAHELGHHLLEDEYQSEVGGVAARRDEREQLVDAFAGEFLLPGDDLRSELAGVSPDDLRARLIKVAADYRLSWSAVVTRARQAGLLDESTVRRERADVPARGEFVAVLGRVPPPDLALGEHGPAWQRAVLRAYGEASITADRAVELLGGALEVDDLPDRDTP